MVDKTLWARIVDRIDNDRRTVQPFCNDSPDGSCRDGYDTDARYGLFYGSWAREDGSTVGWYRGAWEFRVCAYCRAELDARTVGRMERLERKCAQALENERTDNHATL